MLLGQISHDPLHPDFVPSIFAHVDVGSREKLKRKLDRYIQTTATKRKRLETVARTVETPPGELCVAFKMYLYIVYTITVPQDVIATQYQAESLVESIADHLEPLVKDVAVQVNILLNDVAVQVESATFDISVQTEPLVNDFAVQVDLKFSEKVQAQVQTEHAYECHSCTQLMQENGKLLKSTATLSQESMKCNEDKVQFYTGLPNYATLILIIQFVTNGLPLKGKLSHFQQILLVLMKLRLNLEEQDLAYRFSVSQSTVSRVFRKWMYRMSEQLMF